MKGRLRWLVLTAIGWAAPAAAARSNVDVSTVNGLYALALAITYATGWRLAGAWSTDRRQTFKALTITVVLLLGVGLLELAAAFKLVDYRVVHTAITHAEGPDEYIEDPVLSFRRPPHVRWSGWPLTDMAAYLNLPIRIDHRMTFSTDARGFRNRTELSRATIALIGDSYVEGWTLSDDETISVKLQERTGVPVANLGTAGYGSLQELRVLKNSALPLDPKFVAWFFFEGNDLDDDQNFENAMMKVDPRAGAPKPPLAQRWRDFVDRSFTWNAFLEIRRLTDAVVPNAANTYGWFRDSTGATHKMYFYDFYATRDITEFERWRLSVVGDALKDAAETCRRRGVEFVVYYVPIKFRVYGDLVTFPASSPCRTWRPWDLESEFREMCARAGVRVVSLTDPLREAARTGALLYAPADSHWNAAGAAFVADQVAHTFRSAIQKP